MPIALSAISCALPFADAIENYRRVGLIIVPTLAVLIVVFVLIRKKQFRAGQQSGKRAAQELRGKRAYPLGRCCPKCGSTAYSKAKDQEGAIVVFYDRICSHCSTRYTPPTPKWVAVMGVVKLRVQSTNPPESGRADDSP